MDLLCASFPEGIPLDINTRSPVTKRSKRPKKSKRSSRPAPVHDSAAMPSSLEWPYLDAMDGTQYPQPQLWIQPQADNLPPEAMENENPQGVTGTRKNAYRGKRWEPDHGYIDEPEPGWALEMSRS
jgi:hypothetical protein